MKVHDSEACRLTASAGLHRSATKDGWALGEVVVPLCFTTILLRHNGLLAKHLFWLFLSLSLSLSLVDTTALFVTALIAPTHL
jgi:hypothetical protein